MFNVPCLHWYGCTTRELTAIELTRLKSISVSNALLIAPIFNIDFVEKFVEALDKVFQVLDAGVAAVREALVQLESVTEEFGVGWCGHYTQKNVVDLLPQLLPEVLLVAALL